MHAEPLIEALGALLGRGPGDAHLVGDDGERYWLGQVGQYLGLGPGDRRGPDAALSFPGRLAGHLVGRADQRGILRDGLVGSLAGGGDGECGTGRGCAGGLGGGAGNQPGRGEGGHGLLRGGLLDQPGRDQRADRVGRRGRLDLLGGGFRVGGPGTGRDGPQHGLRLGRLRLGDHRGRLFQHGDLTADRETRFPGQEVIADQCAARGEGRIHQGPRPQMLDQQEGGRAARFQGTDEHLGPGHARGRRSRSRLGAVIGREAALVGRCAGKDAGQQRAEVLVLADLEPLQGAILPLGQEDHVEHAQHATALDPVDLGQDALLSIRIEVKGQRDYLEWCGQPALLPSRNDADQRCGPLPYRFSQVPGCRALARRRHEGRYRNLTAGAVLSRQRR